MNKAESEIRTILRERHHIKEGKADDFTIQNQAAALETQKESRKAFTLLISSVAAISLLVGGIGILAVMLISIRERIKEIGIRRAVGAKKSDILIQFLTESLLLSISGGTIGVIIGVILSVVIAIFADWPLSIPINVIAISFLSTFAIGIFFGVYPAKKAASLDPVKALQFE
jgi:putative ABC transport system permease protein